MTFVEVLPPERTGPAHPEWFAERAKGITASEIAAVLGLSPWESPFSLYWRKRGMLPEQADTAAMGWGRRLEVYLADEFTQRHEENWFVVPAGLYAHVERPWQMASPDRLIYQRIEDVGYVLDPVAALECKTAGSWEAWGEEGTDQVPIHYKAQCIWQADVLQVPCVYVPVAVGRTYREYVVQHDEADAKVMRDAALDFLTAVSFGIPPDVDGTPATLDTLRRLNPDVNDEEAEVPGTLAARWLAACRAHKRAEARKKDAEARLRQRMGRARWAVHKGQKVATRVTYDQKPYEVGPVHKDYLKAPQEETP